MVRSLTLSTTGGGAGSQRLARSFRGRGVRPARTVRRVHCSRVHNDGRITFSRRQRKEGCQTMESGQVSNQNDAGTVSRAKQHVEEVDRGFDGNSAIALLG